MDADLAQLYDKLAYAREQGDLATVAILENYTEQHSAGVKQDNKNKPTDEEATAEWMKTLTSPLVVGGVGVLVLLLILRR
jgi:hypothetical protein